MEPPSGPYRAQGQQYSVPVQPHGYIGPELSTGDGKAPMGDQDDGKAGGVTPSAPPIQEMDRIPGYDDIVSPDVAFVPPPPSYQEATSGSSVENITSDTRLTEAEARELLVKEAKSKCCWGKGAAEGMTIKSLQPSTAVHYVLKTFLETRSTAWTSEPFHGGNVDGPHNGPAPSPWEIHIPTPDMFRNAVFKTEVPHTASVRSCHTCRGMGYNSCGRCCGSGSDRCSWCHGSGHREENGNCTTCNWCRGRGHVECFSCSGRGRVPCSTCDTAGRVKCYVRMTTKFKTHEKDFILERTPLPNHLIRNVPGTILFEDTQPLLNPIQSFPEPQVNSQSASIVHEHRALAQTGRIWMQNHVIRGVPVFQCDCLWKNEEFQFFVYGDNRLVHSDNYPHRCCCGCQLL